MNYKLFRNSKHFFLVDKDIVKCKICNKVFYSGDSCYFKVKYAFLRSEAFPLCHSCVLKHRFKKTDYKGEQIFNVFITELIPENCILVDYTKIHLSHSKYRGDDITVFGASFSDDGIGTKDSNPQINNRCKIAFDINQSKQIDYEKNKLLSDRTVARSNTKVSNINNLVKEIKSAKPYSDDPKELLEYKKGEL